MHWADLLIVIVLPFGPPLFLLGRHLLKREVTRGQLASVLTWTVLMLAFATVRELNAQDSWQVACKQLETELERRADDVSDIMPIECVPDESPRRERR